VQLGWRPIFRGHFETEREVPVIALIGSPKAIVNGLPNFSLSLDSSDTEVGSTEREGAVKYGCWRRPQAFSHSALTPTHWWELMQVSTMFVDTLTLREECQEPARTDCIFKSVRRTEKACELLEILRFGQIPRQVYGPGGVLAPKKAPAD
jgi:hypothetical protein